MVTEIMCKCSLISLRAQQVSQATAGNQKTAKSVWKVFRQIRFTDMEIAKYYELCNFSTN